MTSIETMRMTEANQALSFEWELLLQMQAKRYQWVADRCVEQPELTQCSSMLHILALVKMNQLEEAERVLSQQNILSPDNVIVDLVEGMHILKTLSSSISSAFQRCLTLQQSGNLTTVFCNYMVFEEACMQLGSFYQQSILDYEIAVM